MSVPKIYYIMGFLGDEPMPIGPMDFDPNKLHVTYLDKFTLPDERVDDLTREIAAIGKFFWPPDGYRWQPSRNVGLRG